MSHKAALDCRHTTSGPIESSSKNSVSVWVTTLKRNLSTPARLLRRRTRHVRGMIVLVDGSTQPLDEHVLLQPLEEGLRALSWGIVALALGVTMARLG